MSDAKRVIQMVFSGTDELSDKIETITKSFDKSQASIDKFAAPIAGATEKLLALEAAVVATGVALGTYAVSEAVKFQDAQTALEQVLGETTRTVESFGDSALDLSNKFGTAATDVSASFAAFSSAGFAATEVEGLTESILQFATASKTDATVATDALVRILKGFNAEAKESPAILDIITRSTDLYATNVDQVSEALARSSAIAHLSNMSIAETTGVLTPMIEVFQSAEMASTAFNAVMQRLTSDTKTVKDGLHDLGVSQLDANLKMRSAKDILLDVQKAFTTLDPSQKLVTSNLLAGAEHAAKFSYVFDGLAKTAEVTAKSLAGVGTAVDERLRKRMDDTSYAMGLVGTQFKNVAILAGGEFLKGINSAGAGLSTLALTLQDLAKSEGFKTFAEAVGAQLARAGVAIEKFATALPAALEKVDLKAFNEQLTLLGLSFEGLFDGIDLTTPEGLAKALQKIIDLGTQFLAFNRGVVEGLSPVIAAFQLMTTVIAALPSEFIALAGVVGGAAIGWTALSSAIALASSTAGGFGKLIGVGGDLLKSLSAASAATTILGGSMLKTTGYIGLAAAAGYGIGTLFNDYLLDPLAKATTGFDSFGAAIADMVHGPGAELNINANLAGLRIKALADAQREATLATETAGVQWDIFSGQLDAGLLRLGQIGASTTKAAEAQWVLVGSTNDLNLSLNLLNDEFIKQSQLGSTTVEGMQILDGVYTNLDASGKELATSTDQVGEAHTKTAEATAKLAQESEKLDLEWAKLESHERELVFTAAVDLQIENVKAQADQFTALMKSVDTAIESTGTTLLGLANLFQTSQKTLGGNEILSLLRAEEERRKQSFELQKKLIEQQLKYLAASTDKLASGDALITINAEGIEAELKAVLFRVVELAHIEASGVAGPLLLGLPVL